MTVTYRAERALSPVAESVCWVVVDDDFNQHAEANSYPASLRARDYSINTERVYAGRVDLYLSYCGEQGIDWQSPSFDELHLLLKWLVTIPLESRARSGARLGITNGPGLDSAQLSVVTDAVTGRWANEVFR
jgi:hypothetical protein